ncbi:hypothetical protein [Ottowia sp.]|uniref:hypothetical protein n=1 Tax=Ottowia sp. TaxID=1898956 RepID=UPI003A88E5CD
MLDRTGDPELDRLAAALSTGNDADIVRAATQIAQSPQMWSLEQQGRDQAATELQQRNMQPEHATQQIPVMSR